MKPTRPLLAWYRKFARVFPWRTPNTDSYVTLVSEVMLQQTQTSRVQDALPRFLQRFPSVQVLAVASNADVVRQWKGMGYNSRAIRLRDAARKIVSDHAGIVPNTVDSLRSLPGIGPYTAAAVACFAYNKRVVVLDVNVRRVYSRLMVKQRLSTAVESDALLAEYAESVIPQRSSAEWHHAVMDLGATICTARLPRCQDCPLTSICPSSGSIQTVVRVRRKEPLFRGEPQRLWRGRFVDVLRACSGGVTSEELFYRAAATPILAKEREWYTTQLQRLEADGLITISSSGITLRE